jgi:hypothetical protein
MTITQSIPRDANNIPVFDLDWGLSIPKTVTFTGAASLGAIGTIPLYTVTGIVVCRIIGLCSTDLVGATATLEAGVVGNTPGLIAQTTATNIVAGKFWRSATPDVGLLASSNIPEMIVGKSIQLTVATAAITAGVLKFMLSWYPVSEDGNVSAA